MAQRDGRSIDFGIITIREDEHAAVYDRLPSPWEHVDANRAYDVADVPNRHGRALRVALVRCIEPGPGEAQKTTDNLIDDLDPAWLALVGIAGGFPSDEFTLGDVALASRLHDYSVGALLEDRMEFVDQGGPMMLEVRDLIARAYALKRDLSGWDEPARIGVPRPGLDFAANKFYGSEDWKAKVDKALRPVFPDGRPRDVPQVTVNATVAGGFLVKSTTVAEQFRRASRDSRKVEMELGGVYRAAQRMSKYYPVLAVRGISDIVGYERDDAWTRYACNTAASFFVKLLEVVSPAAFRLPREPDTPAPHSPPVKSTFVARAERLFGIDDLVADALAMLRDPAGRHVLGFHGMGGVGKSSLADRIAELALGEELVLKIVQVRFTRDAAQPGTLRFEYLEETLRRELRLEPDAPIRDALHARPYLILLDNLETADESQDAIVRKLCDLVASTAARVLLTSRQTYADPRVFKKRLSGIGVDACRDLIRNEGAHIPGVSTISPSDVAAIHTASGGVPLAIKLAVPQLEFDNLDGVVERLRLSQPASGTQEEDEYRRFYSGILDWSWRALWDRSDRARALDAGTVLVFLSKHPPTPSGAVDVPEMALLTGLERTRVRSAVDLLFRFSLVEVSVPPDVQTERRYFLHPLVQQYVRADLLDIPSA